MALEEYGKKRDFSKTGEPKGSVKSTGKDVFVVQEHHASHLHWDLRLELDGVLKSWAVPKEPPLGTGVKRLAVMTEDHPIDYASFEGEIPKGQYGAGSVRIWDSGTYELKERTGDKIEFLPKGKRLAGTYVLIRFKRAGPKGWLLFKAK
ncbi:MAG: 3'-phosphoesterase [Candidatus Altiarchaeota archaeon]|nr:3'-phosphoesterase [Candidatus Altiarchaeota archaeon]